MAKFGDIRNTCGVKWERSNIFAYLQYGVGVGARRTHYFLALVQAISNVCDTTSINAIACYQTLGCHFVNPRIIQIYKRWIVLCIYTSYYIGGYMRKTIAVVYKEIALCSDHGSESSKELQTKSNQFQVGTTEIGSLQS